MLINSQRVRPPEDAVCKSCGCQDVMPTRFTGVLNQGKKYRVEFVCRHCGSKRSITVESPTQEEEKGGNEDER